MNKIKIYKSSEHKLGKYKIKNKEYEGYYSYLYVEDYKVGKFYISYVKAKNKFLLRTDGYPWNSLTQLNEKQKQFIEDNKENLIHWLNTKF